MYICNILTITMQKYSITNKSSALQVTPKVIDIHSSFIHPLLVVMSVYVFRNMHRVYFHTRPLYETGKSAASTRRPLSFQLMLCFHCAHYYYNTINQITTNRAFRAPGGLECLTKWHKTLDVNYMKVGYS